MTPKQKAIDLYNEFYLTSAHPNSVKARHNAAKYWAAKTVDEILNIPNIEGSSNGHMVDEGYAKVYWQQVKTEIENL